MAPTEASPSTSSRKQSGLSAKAKSKAKASSGEGLLSTQADAPVLPDVSSEEDSGDDHDMAAAFPREALDEGDVLIDPEAGAPAVDSMEVDMPAAPALEFAPLKTHRTSDNTTAQIRVTMGQNRLTPLKRDWMSIYSPLVEECGLQVRMNPKKRCVELKVSRKRKKNSGNNKADTNIDKQAYTRATRHHPSESGRLSQRLQHRLQC